MSPPITGPQTGKRKLCGKIFSREDIFAGRYFRERIFSREDIFAGRYFLVNNIFAKIFQIHFSRNFLHAKIKCYTVIRPVLDAFRSHCGHGNWARTVRGRSIFTSCGRKPDSSARYARVRFATGTGVDTAITINSNRLQTETMTSACAEGRKRETIFFRKTALL